MGLFSKPEVIILKDFSDAKEYLKKLEDLLPTLDGEAKAKVEKEIKITKSGIKGEDNIIYELSHSNMDMVVLHDIYLKTNDGQDAQIDFLVITKKIIYVLECKNLYGNIKIDNNGQFIKTNDYGKKSMYSPIEQNRKHLECIKEKLVEDKNALMSVAIKANFNNAYKSLVVVASEETYLDDRFAKKEIKSQVCRADNLVAKMKQINDESNEPSLSLKEMKEIGEKWLARSTTNNKDYFNKFEELTKKEDPNICPLCGSPLVLREARKGNNAGNKFYGCSSFPKCRYIKNI